MKQLRSSLCIGMLAVLAFVGCDSGEPETPLPDPVDTTPPEVTITAPVPGEEVADMVTIAVDASDEEGVERVELWVEDSLQSTDREAPWELTWDTRTVDNGTWSFLVRAYDAAGNEEVTQPIAVEVGNVATVTFVNGSRSGVVVSLDDGSPDFVLRGSESESYSNPERDSLSYEAATGGYFPSRVEVRWSGSLDLSEGRDRGVSFDVAPSHALFAFENNGTFRSFSRFAFRYAGGDEVQVNAIVYAGEYRGLGYMVTDGLLEVVGYGVPEPPAWVAGVDFTLSNSVNQVVTLVYPQP